MWVVAPGARRRVFYFAVVISGGGESKEVPQGISEARRRAAKTRGKIPEGTGAGWKASSRQSEPVSPARQVLRHSGHSDRLGKKGSLTTERLASLRR